MAILQPGLGGTKRKLPLSDSSSSGSSSSDNDVQIVENVTPLTTPQRTGRKQDPVWALLTSQPLSFPQKDGANNNICRHCHTSVTHHHLTKQVKRHLVYCKSFISVVQLQNPEDRPEWWAELSKKKHTHNVLGRVGAGKGLQSSAMLAAGRAAGPNLFSKKLFFFPPLLDIR